MEDEGLMVGSEITDAIASLEISPNPASDKVSISTKNISGNCTVRIQNITGQTVYSENLTVNGDIILNVADFSKGVYLVELSAGMTYRAKLVIE
jgi:hypothetical protein